MEYARRDASCASPGKTRREELVQSVGKRKKWKTWSERKNKGDKKTDEERPSMKLMKGANEEDLHFFGQL